MRTRMWGTNAPLSLSQSPAASRNRTFLRPDASRHIGCTKRRCTAAVDDLPLILCDADNAEASSERSLAPFAARGYAPRVHSFAPFHFMVLLVAGWLNRHQQQTIVYLRAENRLLRERIVERRLRFTNEERRMLALAGEPVGRAALRDIATLASPETLLRWYRELVAQKYSAPSHKRHASPKRNSIEEHVIRMARENPTWGYTRIRGALRNIGLDVGRSTIARILKSNGLDPAPERVRIPSWKTFLEAHRGAVAAADLFTVEVLTMRGLIRHYVFFVIDVTTRCVQVAGITRQPDGPWMDRMAAKLTDAYDGFLLGKRVLITDRDPLYTARFRATLEAAGTSVVRIPPRSPNLNAFAERFVRSIKSECLRHIVPLSERHLRETVRDYVEHYNTERNHQGIGNVIPLPGPKPAASPDAPVIRRKRLGGLLSYYHREAA